MAAISLGFAAVVLLLTTPRLGLARPFLLNAQQADFRSSPEYIRDHFAHVDSLPFDGVVFSTPSGAALMNGTPRGYADMAAELGPIRGLDFVRLKHNLAWVAVDRPADFFDDWTTTIENFRRFARALREAGVKGILFDNEEYRRGVFNYPENCNESDKSLGEYQDQARLRGREVMRAMSEEYPGIVCLVVHGPYSSFSGTPPEVHRNQTHSETEELRGPFSVGLIEGMDSVSRFVDGGAIYAYRSAEDFEQSYEFRKKTLGSENAACPYISTDLRAVWPLKLGVGFGVYNRAFGGEEMDPATLRTTLGRALARCDEYVWLYFEGENWNAPGEIAEAWKDAVIAARAAVALPPEESGLWVDLTSPATGSNFVSPAAITLRARASSHDHVITKVEFYAGDVKLGEALAAPFAFEWAAPASGVHVLSARAIDEAGETIASSPITITVGTHFIANINFQPANITPPTQYFADLGELFGDRNNGLTYGWNLNHVAHTRDGAGSPDVRLDTLCQMRAGGRWEIAVPNGTYAVTVAIGDGSFASTYTINVEGVSYWNDIPLARDQYLQKTHVVAVGDGKLTIDQGDAGEDETRINYVSIAASDSAPVAPGNLVAVVAEVGSVTLHWRDNSSNESAFSLERSITPEFTLPVNVASIAGDATSYADQSVAAGQEYYYRLIAVNGNGTSHFSAPAAVKTSSPDSDGDGVPDQLEPAPLVVGTDDRRVDSDGDEKSNAAEHFAGTDPSNGSSNLHVSEASLVTFGDRRGATICYPTTMGRRYYVEFNRSLDGGVWTLVPDSEFLGDGSTHCAVDFPDGARFYRVQVVAP